MEYIANDNDKKKKVCKPFFMDNIIFDTYNYKILQIIVDYHNLLFKESIEIEAVLSSFENIEKKLLSLIEVVYNKQRIFSFNETLNKLIHKVVKDYPHFGRDFDIMKYKLKLFTEKDNHLSLTNKMTKEELTQYFGFVRFPAKWVDLQKLFNLKQMAQSFNNVKDHKTKDFIKIEKEINKLLNL